MGIFDKAKDLISQHGDAIDQGIDKAAAFVDEKTGGKYAEQIGGAAGQVKDRLDDLDGQDDQPADVAAAPPTDVPPANVPPAPRVDGPPATA